MSVFLIQNDCLIPTSCLRYPYTLFVCLSYAHCLSSFFSLSVFLFLTVCLPITHCLSPLYSYTVLPIALLFTTCPSPCLPYTVLSFCLSLIFSVCLSYCMYMYSLYLILTLFVFLKCLLFTVSIQYTVYPLFNVCVLPSSCLLFLSNSLAPWSCIVVENLRSKSALWLFLVLLIMILHLIEWKIQRIKKTSIVTAGRAGSNAGPSKPVQSYGRWLLPL